MRHYLTSLLLLPIAACAINEDGTTKFCFSVPCEPDEEPVDPPPEVIEPTIAAPALGDDTACPAGGCFVALGGRASYVVDPGTGGTFTVASDPRFVTVDVKGGQVTVVGTAAGDSELVVDSLNFEPIAAPIAVAERIGDVRLVVPGYTTLGPDVAYLPDATVVVVMEAARGEDVRRAVDESVTLNAEQLAWDTFQLPAAPGPLSLVLAGDTFETRTFETQIVAFESDRLEARTTPTAGGATVCFHSFLGAREVVAPASISVSGITVAERTRNCVTLVGSGEAQIAASALEQSVALTVDVE